MPTVARALLGLGDTPQPLLRRGCQLQSPLLSQDLLVLALAMDAVLAVCRYPNLSMRAVVLRVDLVQVGCEIRGVDPFHRSAVFLRAQHRSLHRGGGAPR